MAEQARPVQALGARELAKLMDEVDALPSVPLVAERVGELVHDPRADARAIAAVMRGDPALTAKVLKLVNSPYFAIPGGVTDITRAISFLGFNAIHQLVLTVSVFQVFGVGAGHYAERFFRHSLAAAGVAEGIAELIGHGETAECFTAGLLHDLGKLAMLQVAPEHFTRAIEVAEAESITVRAAELELGLPSHDALGLRLAKRWRFPLSLQSAIGSHHQLAVDQRRNVPKNLHATVDITGLADLLCHRWGFVSADGEAPPLPKELLSRLNLLPSFERQARDQLKRKIDRSEMLMRILAE
ncbi:MAG: HDOD domain-containing protein [Myxococcales bacterium]|nr:HDOD domain-containing protein [Myxococcales bacterium]